MNYVESEITTLVNQAKGDGYELGEFIKLIVEEWTWVDED